MAKKKKGKKKSPKTQAKAKTGKPQKAKKEASRPGDKGSLHHLKGMRKLDEKIVKSILKNYKNGKGMVVAKILEFVNSKGYNVTYASVRNVCIRATWRLVKV